MKAVQFHEYGDSSVLVLEDVDTPVPGSGQVLVEMAGTSFNPVDAKIRAGALQQVFPLDLPHIWGLEVAGTIATLGDGVTGWQQGDAVLAMLPTTARGTYAEYVVVPADLLTAAPTTVDLADAGALPVGGLTAWQALFDHAGLTAGQTILINGAGGNVGNYAVQLAHRAGAHVTATAGPRSAGKVKARGADEVIDYTATPVTTAAAGQRYDVVLNLVQNTPEEAAALTGLVTDGGVFVSAATPGLENPGRGVRTIRMAATGDPAELAQLVALVDKGELYLDIADRRPLAEVPDIHRQADEGRLPGKTVIVL